MNDKNTEAEYIIGEVPRPIIKTWGEATLMEIHGTRPNYDASVECLFRIKDIVGWKYGKDHTIKIFVEEHGSTAPLSIYILGLAKDGADDKKNAEFHEIWIDPQEYHHLETFLNRFLVRKKGTLCFGET